ncbi:hypothetical protein AVEN_65122-1, partial [Araneus ventricosus]
MWSRSRSCQQDSVRPRCSQEG